MKFLGFIVIFCQITTDFFLCLTVYIRNKGNVRVGLLRCGIKQLYLGPEKRIVINVT